MKKIIGILILLLMLPLAHAFEIPLKLDLSLDSIDSDVSDSDVKNYADGVEDVITLGTGVFGFLKSASTSFGSAFDLSEQQTLMLMVALFLGIALFVIQFVRVVLMYMVLITLAILLLGMMGVSISPF